jgi:hypothetical protein
MNLRSVLRVNILIVMLFGMGACNEKKANAVKIAAETFRSESLEALKDIKYLFLQSVSMPFEDKYAYLDKIAKGLEETNEVNSKILSGILNEDDINKNAEQVVDDDFEKMEKQYYQFAAMFESLPKGSFFSRDAIKKSEQYCLNLTLQLINFSKIIHTSYKVQFAGRRMLLLEKIAQAKAGKDSMLRMEKLRELGKEIIQLNEDEQKYKDMAVKQCIKAAQSGNNLCSIIRNYNKMSIDDILFSVNNTLSFVSSATEGNKKVEDLIKKMEGVETNLKNDPYWKEIMDIEITK